MASNQIHSPSSIPGVDVTSDGPNYNERYAGNEPEVYDLLGIGFGPANLAITVALLEHWDQHKVRLSPRPILTCLVTKIIYPGRRHGAHYQESLLCREASTLFLAPGNAITWFENANKVCQFS